MPTSVSIVLSAYEQKRKTSRMSNDTIDRIVSNAKMFSNDTHITEINKITTESITDWGEAKLASGRITHSTLYTYYNSLRQFLRLAHALGFVHQVDYEKVTWKPDYREKRILKPGQIRKIIRHADPQTAILIRTIFSSGMRISEAVSVTEDLLYDDTVLHIVGKGKKPRPVVIDKAILAQLQTLASLHGGACFIDPEGNQLSRKKAYYYIKKYMITAGFPWATPHTLRHSFCTDLLRNGADITKVSRLMGHANIAVTQIYTHLVTDDIVKAHKLLSIV